MVTGWSITLAGPDFHGSQDTSAGSADYDDYEDGAPAAAPRSIMGGVYEGEHTDYGK